MSTTTTPKMLDLNAYVAVDPTTGKVLGLGLSSSLSAIEDARDYPGELVVYAVRLRQYGEAHEECRLAAVPKGDR